MKVNLGCGDERLTGFLNVDLLAGPGVDIVADLNRSPWDFADDSIESICSYHVFEHVADKAVTLNECYRILVPGGLLESNCRRRTAGRMEQSTTRQLLE